MNSTLPEPSVEQMARSQQLQSEIIEEIHSSGGWISFERYMQRALYTPNLGYYSTLQGLGAEGDFITAPEISPLFSRVVARQIAPVLAEMDAPTILELGAGSGVMAADILLELERISQLPTAYRILELSGGLKARQRQTLTERVPHLLERVVWLDALPEAPFQGVIVANEVLDAIPVERFMVRDGVPLSYGVSTNPQAQLIWSEPHKGGEPLEVAVESLEEGYCSEVRPAITPWIASLSDLLQQGMMLFIDYGYSRAEYYRPERDSGTLKCFYRHHQHEEPLSWPGLQDITAHVDFTAVAEAADQAGLTVAGYTTQAYFLMGGGITQLAETELLDDLQEDLIADTNDLVPLAEEILCKHGGERHVLVPHIPEQILMQLNGNLAQVLGQIHQ